MSQFSRAFYSEPLFSFPGRLHITEDGVKVEIIAVVKGKRTFRSFTPEEFNLLEEMLKSQDYYKSGFDEAYHKELFDIQSRADEIYEFIFKKKRNAHIVESGRMPTASMTNTDDVSAGESSDVLKRKASSTRLNQEIKDGLSGVISSLSGYIEHKTEQESTILENRQAVSKLWKIKRDAGLLPSDTAPRKTELDILTEKYVEYFKNLNTIRVNWKPAPDKAILLLCIISLFDKQSHRGPFINYDTSLIKQYEDMRDKYSLGKSLVPFKTLFLSMDKEPFWNASPYGTKDLFGILEPGLVTVLRQEKSRNQLKNVLISTYL